MSDFSYFSLFTAGLACFAPLVSAYTQPTGDAPEGNPITHPGLNDVVPAGEPFSIIWNPTTQGSVTLVLLKGPSSNAVPQYAIAESIPNNGLYAWTPSTDLAPGQTGYGIQLIDDATGQYQYTTQFGISNAFYSSSSAASASASASATWGSGSWSDGGAWASPSSWSSSANITSTMLSTPITTAPFLRPTGTGAPRNITMVAPTGGASMSGPVTLLTTTTAAPAVSTASAKPAPTTSATPNGAASLAGSLSAVCLAAGLVAFFA